jgi:hypothetical protein
VDRKLTVKNKDEGASRLNDTIAVLCPPAIYYYLKWVIIVAATSGTTPLQLMQMTHHKYQEVMIPIIKIVYEPGIENVTKSYQL